MSLAAYKQSGATDFDRGWRAGWQRLEWGNAQGRRDWAEALKFARPEFEAAWDGRATPASKVLSALALAPGEVAGMILGGLAEAAEAA